MMLFCCNCGRAKPNYTNNYCGYCGEMFGIMEAYTKKEINKAKRKNKEL